MSTAAESTTSSVTTGSQQGSSSGNSRAGGGNRSSRGGRSGRGNHGRGGHTRTGRSNFRGEAEGMNGHVFLCYEERTDPVQYAKTMEALGAYAKKNLKYSSDLSPLFAETATAPKIAKPTKPPEGSDDTDQLIYQEEVKEYVQRARELQSNLAAIHTVAWGQCSDAMRSKIKSLPGYREKSEAHDCVWLFAKINAVMQRFDETKDVFLSLLEARASLVNCRQQPDQKVNEYADRLRALAETIEHHGGTVGENYELVPAQDSAGTDRSDAERKQIARDRTMARLLIRGADRTKYGALIADLANQYQRGRDEYPTNLTEAQGALVNYQTPFNDTRIPRQVATRNTAEASAMTFTQAAPGTPVAGTNGVTHANVRCYNCQSFGHYAQDCPSESGGDTGTTLVQLVQHAFALAQSGRPGGIDPDWILLDSQSTISVFRNASMLRNIRDSGRVLRALTNGGHQDSTHVGEFPNLGEVWYNEDSIANILSLAEVRKVCRVTMDSASEPTINVHRLDGSIMKFQEHPSGLYVYKPKPSNTIDAYTMVTTVAAQKKLFSRRDILAADNARALYRKIGRPSEESFEKILRHNLIRNCPVTPQDAKRALQIYGPDIAALKGKTTKSKAAPHTPTYELTPLPPPVLEHYRKITLCIDFFFVQGIAFLHTISRNIGYRTIRPVTDRTHGTILSELRRVIRLYQHRGFEVCDVRGDHEFECIRDDISPIVLDVVPADSHVGEIERSVRTVKERLRSCVHGLPFRRLPRVMIQHMVADAIRCLNSFPWDHGISDTMSPAGIVTGCPLPDYNALKLDFGTYVQIFDHTLPSNTIRARSLGAIALDPTGNAHGDYHFLSLATGATVSRHQWTSLPMTDTAIGRVEALAAHDGQPLIQESGLVVEWRHDHTVDADEYDRDYAPPAHLPIDPATLGPAHYDPIDADELDYLAADAAAHGILIDPPPDPDGGAPGAAEAADQHWYFDNEQPPIPEHHQHNIQEPQDIPDISDLENELEQEENLMEQEENLMDEGVHEGGTNETDDEQDVFHEGAEDDGETHTMDVTDQGAANEARPYNLRERRNRHGQQFRHAIDEPHDGKSYYPPTQLLQCGHVDARRRHIYGYVMNQMSARVGIKKHGARAEHAIMQEFLQLRDLRVFCPVDPRTLTKEQKQGALRAHNLLKEKRDGTLKGRTVADGRKQRGLYAKAETASPTVSTTALMLTIVVDAYEARDVATADVAGAYLKADMDDFVLIKFTGESVDILCQMDATYVVFVTYENGMKVIYARLDKALYGCVKSALLWYKLFHQTLKKMGFELNPYDPCVANATIEGSQCTIAWYVDDTKISHANPGVVTHVIEELEKHFGKMTVTRGREHTFLGMNIKYNENRTATITMKQYLSEAIDESGMSIKNVACTPAKRNLFEVDETSPPLSKGEGERFHSVTAKLLYVAIRARMDLLLAIGFLSTRVSKSTREDQEKLRRVLEYIKGSMDKEYTLGADHLTSLRTWIDASYAVHPDMKSHTGGVMSFGRGGFGCKSTKQKLNVKSSTEAETVGVSDFLPNTVWVTNYMEAQGYPLTENYLEQDNESAIRLETNGRASAGPRSRHINIRHFWVKDQTEAMGINIRHCPTLQMLADFFTKPLQGALFTKFRNVILGSEHIDSLSPDPLPRPEERVGHQRPDAKGTDGPDVDDNDFILVTRRKKRMKRHVVSDPDGASYVSKN